MLGPSNRSIRVIEVANHRFVEQFYNFADKFLSAQPRKATSLDLISNLIAIALNLVPTSPFTIYSSPLRPKISKTPPFFLTHNIVTLHQILNCFLKFCSTFRILFEIKTSFISCSGELLSFPKVILLSLLAFSPISFAFTHDFNAPCHSSSKMQPPSLEICSACI